MHIVTIAVFVVIFVFSVIPVKSFPLENINDKLEHAFAFFVLYILLRKTWESRSFFRLAVYVFLYGLFIELVQYFLPYRTFSFFDIVANSIGIFAGITFWYACKYCHKTFFKKAAKFQA